MNKKNVARMLLVFVMVLAMFGSTMSVYAAGSLDLVGNGTGTSSSVTTTTPKPTTSTTSGTSSSSSSKTQTSTSTGSVTAGTSNASTATQSNTQTTQTQTTASTTTAQVVQTGNLEKSIPFAAAMAAAILMIMLFVHLQLNQTRIGKSEKYYKEMEDFRFMCRN